MEILASDMPIKVVLKVADVLDESALHAHLGFVAAAATLARMAAGLGTVYVLQGTSSGLYRSRAAIGEGLSCAGPALISIYSASAPGIPPYLLSAAALQGRAFPAFRHDPRAEEASRLVVDGNPQTPASWPVDVLDYEDRDHQRAAIESAFTFVDFVACDPRHAGHFAIVPKAEWNDAMVPAADFIAGDAAANAGKVPYVWMVDAKMALHRALVDESLITAARRCLEAWHSLQALGGVRSTTVERLIARERQSWEAEKRIEIEALQRAAAAAPAAASAPAPAAAPAAAPMATAAAAAAIAEAEPEKKSDDPYIETVRCTTCNECTTINDRMFAYDGNKQAFIKDPSAGTYKQLVEAAESCQVSIIHPGKPRDPNEPGLAELMKRAEAFL
jgi:ferredoxin